MGKVLLPYVEPMYSTYHWMASSGIPAKQNGTSDNWFYNNTVEWKCTRKFLQGFTSPEMSLHTGSIWSMPFLDKFGINTRFVRRCALELIKTMLDDGYYVAFSGVDDYYVKGKSWYREQHFNHDGLIIGYDDDNGTLAIAAYDQRWIFTVFNTPQECFMEGLQALCEKSSYGGIHAVKAKNEAQELNLRAIYEAVKGYLSSDIESYPLTDAGNANGIIVYDYICMYLDKLADGSIPYERRDRRIFRLIWEHKKCMLGRIRAVEERCKWDASLSADYNEVVALADKIRFIYSKFVIKYSNKDLENIQVCLMKMKKRESELLDMFADKLLTELNGSQDDE